MTTTQQRYRERKVLKSRTKMIGHFVNLIPCIEPNMSKKVKRVHEDNGKELIPA